MPFLILALLVLGTLGFCGKDCADDIHGGIRGTKEAVLAPVEEPVRDAGQ